MNENFNNITIRKSDMKVSVESDYSKFKTMNGNREVDGKRIRKISDSIRSVGYIPVPIIVNEKMEIIDGQGRFEALKEFGLPVVYMVVPGAGLEECISMNISSTNWKLNDYISSFADSGNIHYIRLKKLMDDHSGIDIGNIITASTGKLDTKVTGIKSGDFKLTNADYKEADKILDYLDRFVPIIRQRKISNGQKLLSALCFTYGIASIDNERMYKAFGDYYMMLGGYSTTEQALESLTNIYNYRLRNKVYIVDEYKRLMASKLGWYATRYGKAASERVS